ncbi:helicase-exonuclease AddAB subunit AddB [Dethiobacter alkaliphilus]|uniref:helicase-exonuclease AddAB subunit AddB n=1 Tax=Dethiobacter alkaliphilus TaxID=427926 RepID=UPI002227D2E0|nr:helicase-exonuclease AddAB subunit AddB [Dethiobacter alkaliphilus]MCW3489658.1 helicase-exonuclease AddAB subunit AddB [Dethiobacter alkaliphilus]
MTVRFILGRAGSGKTQRCLQRIADYSRTEPMGPPIIFLVPEQATFQMERELAQMCGGGTFRAQVLSFRRLAYHLLQPKGGLPPVMSELGRQMVLRRLLQERQAELTIFGRAAQQPRFCEQLAVQIRELNNYLVSPEMLKNQAASPETGEALRSKLSDLSTVFAAYRAFTAGSFMDPEDTLAVLAAAVGEGALPAGTRVWVDGFAGFTPQEFQVLSALFSTAEHVEVALCLDQRHIPAQPQEDELFHPTLETYLQLRRLVGEAGVPALPPEQLPLDEKQTRFAHSEALQVLEAGFGRLPVESYPREVGEIRLVTAAGTRAEVEAVACDILHLVREKGWRFRDIGMILRDFSRYHDLVAAIFQEYQIPFFVDERRSATHHPLVEFIRSALDAAQANFALDPVLQLLKTDLLPISRETADKLENYVRAHGIRGSRWLDGKPWSFRLRLSLDESRDTATETDAHLEEINEGKTVFGRIFTSFNRQVGGSARPAADFCRALWALLESTEAELQLQKWSEEDANPTSAGQHRQVWSGVVELLEQIVSTLGERQISLQEFSQILQAGLEALTLGLVPAGLDQVIVGSVERSRQPRLRAAYVLGLSEGDFPARLKEEGLLADEEREALQENGVELAVTKRQKLFHEQYLSYIALTRSSEYLWVSCPLADEEGKAKRPSALFNRLRETFPYNDVHFFGNTPDSKEDLHALAGAEKSAAALLLQAGGVASGSAMSDFWAAAYNEALSIPQVYGRMRMLWPSLTERNHIAPLPEETVREILGTELKSSVSRLEQFARCPFAHFARYVLRLQERHEFRVEAPEMGNFFHHALRLFAESLQAEGLDWAQLETEEAQTRMNSIVEELIPRLQGEILLSSARMRYLAERLKETLAQAVAALTEHARRSQFKTVAVEMSFGSGKTPAWQLRCGQTQLKLYGQIDRIDLAEAEGKAWLRVIDYKSTPMELKLSDVWHGLSLQLLAYLAVVKENALAFSALPAESAGALYFGIHKPYERLDNPPPEAVTQKPPKLDGLMLAEPKVLDLMGGPDMVRAGLKRDGSFTQLSRVADAEQTEALFTYLREKLFELAREITSGRVEAAPFKKADGSRACTFCPFMPVCRFDVSMEGNRYRHLSALSHRQVLELVSSSYEGGEACGQSVDG